MQGMQHWYHARKHGLVQVSSGPRAKPIYETLSILNTGSGGLQGKKMKDKKQDPYLCQSGPVVQQNTWSGLQPSAETGAAISTGSG